MQKLVTVRRRSVKWRVRKSVAVRWLVPAVAAAILTTSVPAVAAPPSVPPAPSNAASEAQAAKAERAARTQREAGRVQAAAADPNGIANLGMPRPRLPEDSQATRDSAEQEFRDACNDPNLGRGAASTPQGWTRNRYQQCFLGHREVELWRRTGTPPPTSPIAEMEFDYSLLVNSYNGSRKIDFIFSLHNVQLKGGTIHEITDLAVAVEGCNADTIFCSPLYVKKTNVEWRSEPKRTFSMTSSDDAGEGVDKRLHGTFKLNMNMYSRAPNVEPWTESQMTWSDLRFDSNPESARKSGAVFDQFVPTYDLLKTSDPAVDESARHILDAQFHPKRTYPQHTNGAKAVPGYESPLRRLIDPTSQKANGDAAGAICDVVWTRLRSGKDCDEYPFRSTFEGASTSPLGKPWHGSARLIDSSDNRTSGSRLNSSLYNENRVIYNDPFRVRVVDDCETCGRAFPAPFLPRLSDTDRRISGSFIQPDLIDQWTDAQLAEEFRMMKELNMSQLVLQWTANTYDNRENGAKTAIYPTGQAGYRQVTNTDVVRRTLEAAQQFGIDVWVGLQVNDKWWNTYAKNEGYLNDEAASAKALARELWSRYHDYSSFRGWYLAFEMDNVNFPDRTHENRMVAFYRDVVAELRGLTGPRPVAIAPFFNAVNTALPGWKNAQEWEAMWTRMLPWMDIDIIALQDGIGAGHGDPTTIHPWFAGLNRAIGNTDSLTSLVSDTETFKIGASGLQPMSTEEVVSAIRAVQDQTEVFWSFSFNHYQSPRSKFGSQAYLRAYRAWAPSGTGNGLDGDNPSQPTNLTATAQGSQTVNLAWNDSSDGGSGVAGYFIYRDDELVATKISPSGGFVDRQLTPGSLNRYQVRAFDGSGRTSPLSNYAEAGTEGQAVSPVNYARCGAADGQPGCRYTTQKPADQESYPDTGGIELTDGKHGPALYTPEWQGRNAAGIYEFVIDLGQVRQVNEINSSWLQVRDNYVFLPTQVTYSVATAEGGPYQSAEAIDLPAVSARLQTKTYRSVNLNLTGRYVKIRVDGSTAWTMLDEVEVRGR